MLNFRWIGTIVFFLLQNTVSKAQDIYLDTNWKYSFQDSAAFASADFNDAEWLEKSGNALMFTEKELTSPTIAVKLRYKSSIFASKMIWIIRLIY